MREFLLPVIAGVAAALAWMAVWVLVLRAFGIPVLKRSPEERALRKERILALGKLRYVLIFGVMGGGFGFGLGMFVAKVVEVHHFIGWFGAAVDFALSMIQGLSTWSQFRGEVPFPPQYPPQK